MIGLKSDPMSRNRASSVRSSQSGGRVRSSSINQANHGLDIKCQRIPRPFPLNAHDVDNPEQPPLPQMQLSLPRNIQPIYVGEKYQCAFSIQNLDNSAHTGVLEVCLLSPSMLGNFHVERSEDILILREKFTVDENKPFEVFNLEFDVPEAGMWALVADVRHNGHTLSRQFPLETKAVPAISVRTKVSKGSSGIQAYVLETQVENLTESLLVIESAALISQNEWSVTTLSEDKSVMLRSKDVHQFSFILKNGSSHEAGNISVAWRREPLGAKGWQTTGLIRV